MNVQGSTLLGGTGYGTRSVQRRWARWYQWGRGGATSFVVVVVGVVVAWVVEAVVARAKARSVLVSVMIVLLWTMSASGSEMVKG